MKKQLLFISLAFLSICQIVAQTFSGTPASCVITQPHCNAYFQAGKAMTIRVYSADIGGSSSNGTVSKVEFFDGTTKLGESTTHSSNTFSFVYNNLTAGSHIITAKATDNSGNVSNSAGVVVTVGTAATTAKGLSSCKGMYLANIIGGTVHQNYNTYWNGVTAENDCKWGSVEGTRNSMNWTGADRAYNHAKNNNMMFRYHALAWGSQYPSWITSLSVADFKSEMIQYMDAVATRFPLTDQIDVLNEQIGNHASGTGYFRDGLGGNNGGSGADANTGYDWQIWLFRQARAKFPNAKLVLNDYGLENDQNAIRDMLKLVKVLRDRNLIDGFGTQAHEFNINTLSATALRSSLDLMATGGVPIYVTELDISGDDTQQGTRYQTLFTEYWNHKAVGGITLWGYVDGTTWKDNTGIVSSGNNNPTESPAMKWIKTFISGKTDVGYPFCTLESVASVGAPIVNLTAPTATLNVEIGTTVNLSATATDADGSISKVEFYSGTTLLGTDSTSPYNFTWTPTVAGTYSITAKATDNKGNTANSSAVTVNVKQPRIAYNNSPAQIPGKVEFELFDEGGQGDAYNDLTTGSETSLSFRAGTDVDIETCTDAGGGYNIGYATTGEWLEYTVEVNYSGVYDIDLRLAADGTNRTFKIIMGGKTIVNSVAVPNTGGWQTWQTLTIPNVTLVDGKQIMRIEFTSDYMNLNYANFKVKTITGIDQALESTAIVPNPFKESVDIQLQGDYEYTFYTLDGKAIESGNQNSSFGKGSSLNSGAYLLMIRKDNQIIRRLMSKE